MSRTRFCTECGWARIVSMGSGGDMVYCARNKERERKMGISGAHSNFVLPLSFKKTSSMACPHFTERDGDHE